MRLRRGIDKIVFTDTQQTLVILSCSRTHSTTFVKEFDVRPSAYGVDFHGWIGSHVPTAICIVLPRKLLVLYCVPIGRDPLSFSLVDALNFGSDNVTFRLSIESLFTVGLKEFLRLTLNAFYCPSKSNVSINKPH